MILFNHSLRDLFYICIGVTRTVLDHGYFSDSVISLWRHDVVSQFWLVDGLITSQTVRSLPEMIGSYPFWPFTSVTPSFISRGNKCATHVHVFCHASSSARLLNVPFCEGCHNWNRSVTRVWAHLIFFFFFPVVYHVCIKNANLCVWSMINKRFDCSRLEKARSKMWCVSPSFYGVLCWPL